MTHDHNHELTPSELAEAEATRDLADLDPDDVGRVARRAAEMPLHPAVSDTDLAHADCDSDLSHSEPPR